MQEKRETWKGGFKAGDTLVSARSGGEAYREKRRALVQEVECDSGEAHSQALLSKRAVHEALGEAFGDRKEVDKSERATLPSGVAPRTREGKMPEPSALRMEELPARSEVSEKIGLIFDLYAKEKPAFEECQQHMDWLSQVFFSATPVKFTISEGEILIDKENLEEVVAKFSENNFLLVAKVVQTILDCL